MDYGGGGTAHGWERSMINLCVLGCPLPPYIKEKGGRPAGPVGRARRSPTPTGSRTPSLFLVGLGEEREGERGGKERGEPPPPCPIRTWGGGARGCPLAASPLPPIGPMRPNNLRGVPVTPRYSGIYQSSCLDHFETPRYVCDLIRDSELSSEHQNT